MPRPLAIAINALFAISLAVAAAVAPAAAQYRIEGGVGWTNADHDAEDDTGLLLAPGEIDGFGGSGLAVEAAAWVDGLLWPDLSIGAQYLRFENHSNAEFTINGDFNDFDADLTLNAAMANLAWRLNEGRMHPFIGGGIGAAYVDLDVSRKVTNAGASPPIATLTEIDENEVLLAGQVFVGFDMDLTDRFYVGASGRYFIFDGGFFGSDVDLRELSLTVHAGYKF